MKFHPFSEIFPLIEGTEFDALVADIKEHGLRDSIWLYEGKILDGRNRFLACKKAGKEPQFLQYEGEDPLALVISANMHRRHMTVEQRAMAAARLATLGKGGNPNAARAALTQDGASKQFDVSKDSIQRAKKVVGKGSAPLKKAVESGEVSLKKAAAVTDLPKREQLEAAQKKPEPSKPLEVTPPPDFDFEGYEPEDDEEYRRNIESVMMADDKLAALRDELKQRHREIQALKASRDHYQSQAGEAVRLVKARDREIEKLKRDLAKAREKAAA
jgi:hypothetical protein